VAGAFLSNTRNMFRVALVLAGAAAALSPASAHGPHGERLARLDRQLAEDPANVEHHLTRSILYLDHGDFPMALADLERAAQLDPTRIEIDFLRGSLYLAWKRPGDALPPLERFLSRAPEHGEAQVLIARALAQLGRPLEAAQHLDLAIERAALPIPTHYLERAQALAAAGAAHIDEALRGLDAGMARLGPIPALASFAVELELARGQVDLALERLARSSASPSSPAALVRRAEILERAERRGEARIAYAQALAQLESLPAGRRGAPAVAALEPRAREALARLAP